MDLDFEPTLPADVRVDLVMAAQRCGIPLQQLELLGQDESVARAFASSVRAGTGRAFLTGCDWDRLERLYDGRRKARAGGFWTRRALGIGVPEVLPLLLADTKRKSHEPEESC